MARQTVVPFPFLRLYIDAIVPTFGYLYLELDGVLVKIILCCTAIASWAYNLNLKCFFFKLNMTEMQWDVLVMIWGRLDAFRTFDWGKLMANLPSCLLKIGSVKEIKGVSSYLS